MICISINQESRRFALADMLLVATCQVRHPFLRGILMKTNDLALHGGLTCRPSYREAVIRCHLRVCLIFLPALLWQRL